MLVLAICTTRAVPEPTVELLFDGVEEVLAHNCGFVAGVLFGAVLASDDCFELLLIPHLDRIFVGELKHATLLLTSRDIKLVRILALVRRFGTASMLEKLTQNRLRVHAWWTFRLFHIDTLCAQQKFLLFLGFLSRRSQRRLTELRRRIRHILQTLQVHLVLFIQPRALRLPKR